MIDRIAELDQLRQIALTCRDCHLAERRRNVAFGEGKAGSPLVLVGEGPGEQEDQTGRPFVGKAGQLLDQALLENDLTREHVYICNIVKCRACDWVNDKPVNRAPTDAEADACRRWLLPQLRALAPMVVLSIGGPSAKNLIRKDFGITKERGRFFPSVYARCAIATLHPAYVLRQRSATNDGGFSLMVADIAKAWAAANKLAEQESAGLLKPFVFGTGVVEATPAEEHTALADPSQTSLF